MRKLKLLFAACALLGAMTANAQEDVTSTYLKNADLSVDPATADNGWILVDNWRQDYQKATDDEHVNVLEFYAGWGGLDKTSYGMSQTVTLPAGDYRLAVNAFYRQGNDGNGTNNNAYIYAGDVKQQNVYALVSQSELWAYSGSNDLWKASNAFKNGQYSNEFDFSLDAETTLDLGFRGTFDEARCWVILGPVKLYKYSLENYLVDYRVKVAEAEALYDEPMNADVLAALKAAVVEESTFTKSSQVADAIQNLNEKISAANLSISNYTNLKKIIDDYAAIVANYDAAGQSAYATASADAIAAYNNRTATDGNDQIAALKAALANACKAQTQPGDGCDMSPWIVNPGIDGNKDGWTTNMNGNGGYVGGPMKPSNDAMEFWAAGTLTDQDKGKTFDYYQTITNLPNGIYTIGADLLNSTNGETGAVWDPSGQAGVYGKTGSSEVIKLVTVDGETFLPYTTDGIVVYDGTLTIGVKNIAALSGRWFACDNFNLTYVRQLKESDKTTFTASFVNGEGWETVCAYAWNSETDVKTAAWPGDEITKSGSKNYNGTSYDVYTYSITDFGMPKNIIFNNGNNGQQTTDLTFEDGMVNDDKVTKIAVYAVIGSNQAETDKAFFSGIWDAANTTDIMTESEGKWTISFTNVTLEEPVIFKVIKKAYLEATEVEAWYPAGDNYLINQTGDFDIVITMKDGNVEATCTPLTELFTVTAAGWATAKTAHAVDFTGVVGLKAYIATLEGTTVTLTEATEIPANTPIVLKGETAKADIIETAPAVENNALTWYDKYDVNDSYAHIYALTVKDGKAKFARVADGVTFYNKAVIELRQGGDARELNIVFADETTGIETVAAEKNADGVYNLNGQRVAAPAKGLYIVNGKKVVLK